MDSVMIFDLQVGQFFKFDRSCCVTYKVTRLSDSYVHCSVYFYGKYSSRSSFLRGGCNEVFLIEKGGLRG